MLRIYLPSSTDLKLCSDVPTINFVDTWTFVTIFTSRYLGPNIWVLADCGLVSNIFKNVLIGMKMPGWKCEDENAGMKMLGMKKPGDESEKIKCPRMKCHAAKSVWVIVGKKSSNNRIVHSAAMVDWNFQSSCSI